MLGLIYLLLGYILDDFSIVVMTLHIALPLTTQLGFDPIWFGVLLILILALSQITPPVGFNLFDISGLIGNKIGNTTKVAFSFFLLMILAMLPLTIFQQNYILNAHSYSQVNIFC